LKDIKGEIESIQALIERNHAKLQKDFEKWFEVMLAQQRAMHSTNTTANPILSSTQRNNLGNTGSISTPKPDLNKSTMSTTTTVSQLESVRLLVFVLI
jgi:hypothetical protein